MNNLHRELAPISDAAWADIEAELKRTFTRNLAARRVVDVIGPTGPELAAVGTGHLEPVTPGEPSAGVGSAAGWPEGVRVHRRLAQAAIELRVPFTVTREAVDDVERGAKDSDWQPVKDAATQLAYAEDRAIVEGLPAAGIVGIGPFSSNPAQSLPSDAAEVPDAVARAISALRLAGVDGPYSLLVSAEAYTTVAETTDHGYPVLDHLARLLGDGQIVWAPAITGALLVSTRGGDYELHLGRDLSIGYRSHDADAVELYLEESIAFLALTAEAGVRLTAS